MINLPHFIEVKDMDVLIENFEFIRFVIIPIFTFIIGFLLAVFIYNHPQTKTLRFITKFWRIESEKFRNLTRNHYNIAELQIIDSKNKPVSNPYALKDGKNIFKCMATYTDGTREEYSPYWLCWTKGNDDPWCVLGKSRREEVGINRSERQERYSELSCWVFPPKRESETGNVEIPHASIGFRY